MNYYENLDINDLDDEVWEDILEYERLYQVSNLGRVKSFYYNKINGKILKQHKDNDGYYHINLYKNRKKKTKYIHRLVFETFKEKLEEGYNVHHIDEEPENNIYENLKSIPESEHHNLHRIGKHHAEETKKKMSKKQKCENNPNHKLSNKDILDIIKSLELKLYTPKQLSWMFDISIQTISKIKNGRTWKL